MDTLSKTLTPAANFFYIFLTLQTRSVFNTAVYFARFVVVPFWSYGPLSRLSHGFRRKAEPQRILPLTGYTWSVAEYPSVSFSARAAWDDPRGSHGPARPKKNTDSRAGPRNTGPTIALAI